MDNKQGYVDWKRPAGAGWFHITGGIDAKTAGDFTAAVLNWLDNNQGKPGVYVVYLNSVGGFVQDAIAIREMINFLRRDAHKVIVVVLRSASCANLILTAADEVYMGCHSWCMIHAVESSVTGDPGKVRAEADFLPRLNSQTMWLMSSPQLSAEQLETMVKNQCTVWLSAQECLQHGLINGILPEPAIKPRQAG